MGVQASADLLEAGVALGAVDIEGKRRFNRERLIGMETVAPSDSSVLILNQMPFKIHRHMLLRILLGIKRILCSEHGSGLIGLVHFINSHNQYLPFSYCRRGIHTAPESVCVSLP